MAKIKETKAKRDLHKEVTTAVVTALRGGSLPWTDMPSLPFNASTGAPYHGVNVLSLWMAQKCNGFPTPAWVTYKQAEALGAQVRKGEKGQLCVKYSVFEKKTVTNGVEEIDRIPYLSSFVVFNVAQVDGMPERLVGPQFSEDGAARLEALLQHMGAKVVPSTMAMGYDAASDSIMLPPAEAFESEELRLAGLAHAHVAWTRTAERCKRVIADSLDQIAYEELVSEMGAAFLCAQFGLCNSRRNAENVEGWIAMLEEDPKVLFKVAKHAAAAAEWLIGQGPKAEEEEVPAPEELARAA